MDSFSRREADLFLADLLGPPARRPALRDRAEAADDDPWSGDRAEPFFGDGPDHRWLVVAASGTTVRLRHDDLVVRRMRRDGRTAFRAVLGLDARPASPDESRWRVPHDTVVLRRTRRRAPPVRLPTPPPPDRPWEDQPPSQQPYLPPGGRAFVPQPGSPFSCAPTPFVVVPASFLPEATTGADAAIDAALTSAGLSSAQRGRVTRDGLRPIAAEFGARALAELLARLRWSPDDIAQWGHGVGGMLVPRLLLHVPGHFRELARRAPDAREAFVLECLGWLLMVRLRSAVEASTRRTWWLPPAPTFVTAVPNPIPPLSAGVSSLVRRWLYIDTSLAINVWNGKLTDWGTSLAGRQWQAEVFGTQAGRPFYASLVTIPGHVDTAAVRAQFDAAWTARTSAVDARHTPHVAGAAAVTLDGLRNAVELRTCDGSGHLAAGSVVSVPLQGLHLAAEFPATNPRVLTALPLMARLAPTFVSLFAALRSLGWNDLLYATGGGHCFRGIRHPGAARIAVDGRPITVDPFTAPDATAVTRVNTLFTAAQRTRVIAASLTARRPSNHLYGMAIDFNVPENEQAVATRRHGSMDPRLVAMFGAFHFQFGACFTPSDPMHFDYCVAPCAPAPATTGTLGPVVTPKLLLPLAAGTVLT